MKGEIVYDNYQNGETVVNKITFPEGVDWFSTGYDGGRFYLIINGVEVYETSQAGDDFCIEGKVIHGENTK